MQALPQTAPLRRALPSWILVTLVIFAVIYFPIPASASSSGITGFSGKSGSTCTSCHSTGTAPAVTLSGPTTVASGSTNSYTLTVGGTGNHGLDVAASAGTFTAGAGTKVQSGEITQSSPSTTGSWTFSWTAPVVTSTTTATLWAAAVNGFSGGTGTVQQAITVTAPVSNPTLNVSPASLSFAFTTGGSTPPSQTIAVSSSGAAITYTVSASTTTGGGWLTATGSGTTTGNVTVSVNASGLAAGTYSGTVSLASSGASNSPKTVPVTLTVTSATLPTLNASPASLSFTYQSGGATPAAQSVSLSSSGAALSYTITSSATWLSATPASGATPGSVSVSVNPAGLAVNTYTGNITVACSGASNCPKAIPVTLTVTSASLPTLTASPLSLSFTYASGGTPPASQSVSLTSSGSALSYTAASTAAWLTVTPSGTTPGSLSVSVNPTGLAVGTYTGTVTVTSSGASNSPQKVAVTLGVTGTPPSGTALNISPGSLSFSYLAGSTAPGAQTLSIGSTGTALKFTAAASGGNWLTVSCGHQLHSSHSEGRGQSERARCWNLQWHNHDHIGRRFEQSTNCAGPTGRHEHKLGTVASLAAAGRDLRLQFRTR